MEIRALGRQRGDALNEKVLLPEWSSSKNISKPEIAFPSKLSQSRTMLAVEAESTLGKPGRQVWRALAKGRSQFCQSNGDRCERNID